MKHLVILAMFCAVSGTAIAQTAPAVSNDLTVTLAPGKYRICNARPDRPAWMDELHPREAYKALAAMEIYELRAWEQIIETSDCSCETRFPSWDDADEEYNELYRALTQGEHTAVRLEWVETRKSLKPVVRELCEAQGNW